MRESDALVQLVSHRGNFWGVLAASYALVAR